jgi:dTMP kinase
MIVLADRYVYTAFTRDVARGVDPQWVREVYSIAPRPDLALYFRVPIEVSLERILSGRQKPKYHEAGMDLGLSKDPIESYRLFQSRVLETYESVAKEFDMKVIDATGEIDEQQRVVRRMVQRVLRGVEPLAKTG